MDGGGFDDVVGGDGDGGELAESVGVEAAEGVWRCVGVAG